jgi:tRNA A-37 threonylcarbamoyl transferase component Bud32
MEVRERLVGAVVEGNAGVRYHLRELLGEGGQGWVYRARYDDPDGIWVVVKVLRPENVQTEALDRFHREAEVLRLLGAMATPNPNIVRFYDHGTATIATAFGEAQLPFTVLEHVDGPTLAQVIEAHGGFGLPITRVRRIMKQVARALHTVHAHRIVHRDLKPSNVLLAQAQGQEVAKVTDFGLVKLPELSAQRTATVAGASLGYAPPEQYEMGNRRVCPQTDVFAFATILFEALSGTEAYPYRPGDNPLRVVARMLSDERPSLARVTATLPRELRERPELAAALDVELARAASPDPALRHGSIRELWERVEPTLLAATAPGPAALAEEPAFEGVSAPAAPPREPSWRLVGRPMTGERLRSAAFAPDGKSVVAVGAHGLYRFAAGVWSAMLLPPGVDARFVRGVARTPSGELLLFGDAGLALVQSPSGQAEDLAIADRDLTLLGAVADEQGIALVGERLSRPVGVLVELPARGAPRVHTLEGTLRLHGVARLAMGSLVACGTHGALVEVDAASARAIGWARTGHLYAIAAAADGGAFAVGSGGHALRISPPTVLPGLSVPPTATLEAVQTTRDLACVAVDGHGVAWAAGGQARLLARRGNVWTRVAVGGAWQGQLIAASPRDDGVTALGEDGAVVEGTGVG